jgi:hypothetical protein
MEYRKLTRPGVCNMVEYGIITPFFGILISTDVDYVNILIKTTIRFVRFLVNMEKE